MLPPTLVTLCLLLASSNLAHAETTRAMSLAGVQSLIAARQSAAGLEPHRKYIEREIAEWPENLPALYAEPKFRTWYSLLHLLDRPVRNVEQVSPGLGSPDPLTRILVGLQLAHAGPNALRHLEFVIASLARARFAQDRHGRDHLVFEELTEVSLEDYEKLLDLVGRTLEPLREDTSGLREISLGLPALPERLEYARAGERYGELQLRLYLGPEPVDEGELIRRLTPLILDRSASRTLRLAAARGLRRVPIGHPAKIELERILKWRHQNTAKTRWWSRSQPPREKFFVAERGLAAEMFRAWQSRDEDYIEYILEMARGLGPRDVPPAVVADVLTDLELSDERFLFLFDFFLSKAMYSNMPLFFATFVELWPENARRILAALHVVRHIPEFSKYYLDVLVNAAERRPMIVAALREARVSESLGRGQEIWIGDAPLDAWLEGELDRRACARALDAELPKENHAQS